MRTTIAHTITRAQARSTDLGATVDAIISGYEIDPAATYEVTMEYWNSGQLSETSGKTLYMTGTDVRNNARTYLMTICNVIEQENSSSLTLRWTLPNKGNDYVTRRFTFTKVTATVLDIDENATYRITSSRLCNGSAPVNDLGTIAGADLAAEVDATLPNFGTLWVGGGEITLRYPKRGCYGLDTEEVYWVSYTKTTALAPVIDADENAAPEGDPSDSHGETGAAAPASTSEDATPAIEPSDRHGERGTASGAATVVSQRPTWSPFRTPSPYRVSRARLSA
ncbi:hypothetical protein [Kitasatospora aureofaciens]|uniref:hypothetical protein n=1 Tax=Kitasatospora aureofaciens TaxID=1894 RepID=UPI0033E76567